MRVNSWNEWDPLESVIVGRADGARVPRLDRSLLAINYAGQANTAAPAGPYPARVIDEANADLENLCSVFESLGIRVYRPDAINLDRDHCHGEWRSDGYHLMCPRDSVLVHGGQIIEAPMPLRSRHFETDAFRRIFNEAMLSGARWVSAPKPLLNDDCYNIENVDRDTLTLNEVEPCFDAANVLRCGRDLFYLRSNSGNKLGAIWLQEFLGSEYKVHVLEGIYSYMHLDSTISFLRPGLVLLNPSRVNENNMPEALKSWDKIWCPMPVDIGYFEPYNHASPWIGMNLLMVNPQLAIVEEHQETLIQLLKSNRIESIPVPMRHSRTLGGCIHCVTLDLSRSGKLEGYF